MDALASVVGFSATGRHGELGAVVDVVRDRESGVAHTLVVRGGRSGLLVFHVPASLVSAVRDDDCELVVDADVVDFTARPAADGTVELVFRGG